MICHGLPAYNLRSSMGHPALSADDRTSQHVSGAIATANLQLTGWNPASVIYNLSYDGVQLRFLIGGYVASSMQL